MNTNTVRVTAKGPKSDLKTKKCSFFMIIQETLNKEFRTLYAIYLQSFFEQSYHHSLGYLLFQKSNLLKYKDLKL